MDAKCKAELTCVCACVCSVINWSAGVYYRCSSGCHVHYTRFSQRLSVSPSAPPASSSSKWFARGRHHLSSSSSAAAAAASVRSYWSDGADDQQLLHVISLWCCCCWWWCRWVVPPPSELLWNTWQVYHAITNALLQTTVYDYGRWTTLRRYWCVSYTSQSYQHYVTSQLITSTMTSQFSLSTFRRSSR